MLILLLLAVLPLDSIARESCDKIEVNLFYDDQARLVFEQLLFYDWHDSAERFNLRGWRMVKNQSQLPRLNQFTNRYECHWMDGDIERIVTAPVVSYSQTQFDPELTEREFLAKERRRELRSPKSIHPTRKGS